jgi:transposase
MARIAPVRGPSLWDLPDAGAGSLGAQETACRQQATQQGPPAEGVLR